MDKPSKFLADTSLFIAHLRQTKPNVYQQALQTHGQPIVSQFVIFELEVGARRVGRALEFKTYFPYVPVIPLDDEITIQAAILHADLTQKNQIIGLPDVFIAATALTYHLPFLTLNRRHFERISGLVLLSIE